jgi:hypothetical protein
LRPRSTGLTSVFGLALPLTLPSGLSVQSGALAQLEVWPETAVTWSSSDPGRINPNTTGAFVVVQGADSPVRSNETQVIATSVEGSSSIRVNSFAFDHFPRLTTLVWRPVTGAASYDVVVEYGNGCTAGTASCVSWTGSNVARTNNLAAVLEFVGAQPGRWRVVARNANGVALSVSEYVYFAYVR